MTNKNAINFLLYSYFEITLESGEDELLKAAVRRAYRDASSRVLSIGDNDKANGAKGKATGEIVTQIGNLPTEDYNAWLDGLCTQLQGTFKDSSFHFGHAQKWVNMTMKYLYIIKNIFSQYGKKVFLQLTDDLERQLHIPVDSYIMWAATRKPEEAPFGLGIKLPSSKKTGEKVELSSYSSAKAWSKWEQSDYETFRAQIAGKISESPLDWEGPAWIKVAEERKEKEAKGASKNEKV